MILILVSGCGAGKTDLLTNSCHDLKILNRLPTIKPTETMTRSEKEKSGYQEWLFGDDGSYQNNCYFESINGQVKKMCDTYEKDFSAAESILKSYNAKVNVVLDRSMARIKDLAKEDLDTRKLFYLMDLLKDYYNVSVDIRNDPSYLSDPPYSNGDIEKINKFCSIYR